MKRKEGYFRAEGVGMKTNCSVFHLSICYKQSRGGGGGEARERERERERRRETERERERANTHNLSFPVLSFPFLSFPFLSFFFLSFALSFLFLIFLLLSPGRRLGTVFGGCATLAFVSALVKVNNTLAPSTQPVCAPPDESMLMG